MACSGRGTSIGSRWFSAASSACSLATGDAGLHGDGHVAGGIVDDLRQAAQIDGQSGTGRRQAEVEQGPAAERIEGLSFGGGAANEVADLDDAARLHDGQGAEVVDVAGVLFHDDRFSKWMKYESVACSYIPHSHAESGDEEVADPHQRPWTPR